jgi:hypothetical protein
MAVKQLRMFSLESCREAVSSIGPTSANLVLTATTDIEMG